MLSSVEIKLRLIVCNDEASVTLSPHNSASEIADQEWKTHHLVKLSKVKIHAYWIKNDRGASI